MTVSRRRGVPAFLLASVAVLWSGALVTAAFLAPFYATETEPGGDSGTATLVAVNGPWVVAPVAAPLIVSVAVWCLLRARCSRPSRRAGHVALGLIALLLVFSLIAAASIGLLFAPAALLLVAAYMATPAALDSAAAAPAQ